MQAPQPEKKDQMNHIVMRTGLVISCLTIFTFVWTALIQPILTLQQQVILLTYRVNALEKVIESLSSQSKDREREPSQSLGMEELEAQRKSP